MKGKDGKNYNLTPKQERFIAVYLKEGCASTAYKDAYNTSNMKPETINRAAKQLLDNYKIATRIDELKQRNAEKLNITLDYLAERMVKAVEMAERQDNSAAYGQNLERLAKLTGNWLDKQHVTHDGDSPTGWLDRYKEQVEKRKPSLKVVGE